MNSSLRSLLLFFCFASAAAHAQQVTFVTTDNATQEPGMDIQRNVSRPSAKGPAEYFTGNVRVDPLFSAPEPSRSSGAYVTFEPAARSNWHTHPLGQTLIVTAGTGLVQSWGGPIRVIRPGDVVWCPPGEKHWHGAIRDTAMTHIAIQEAKTARSSNGWSA